MMRRLLATILACLFATPAWAANSTILVPTGQYLDTESLSVAGVSVQRQRIQISGTTDASVSAVLNSAPTTEYGLVTRNIPSGTQTVTGAGGTFPATQSGTWTVQPGNTANTTAWIFSGIASDNTANSTAKLPVIPCVANASVPSWTEGRQVPCSVDLAGSQRTTVTNGSSVDGSSNAIIVGSVAHDGVDSGAPVKIGYKAIAHGSNPTAVAAADRTDGYANRHGIPFVITGHMNPVTLEAAYTSAQTDAAIVTVSAGTKIVVTRAGFVCDNANTVNVAVRIGFAAATTPTTTGVLLTHPGVAAGSGVLSGNGGGILGVGADGEDVRITSGVPTTGSCRALLTYYTIES